MRNSVTAWAIGLLLLVPATGRTQTSPAAPRAGVEAPESLPEVESELAKVELRREERILDVVIGPVDLPADVGHLRLPIQMVTVPVDGWMHGFEVVMEDAGGRELPRDLLHHVNLIDPDRRELFNPTARRVMAAGSETATQRLPVFLGYPIEVGSRLLVVSMFSNPTGRAIEDAYLHVRLFYSEETDGLIRPRDVYPFYIDVMGPVGEKDFPVPPGRTVRSWEGSPAIDGRLLAIGGHLHRYATEIRFEDATTGEVIWRAEPELDENGDVIGVPTKKFLWRLGVPLRSDHEYRAVVEYVNPTDEPATTGGMGAIGGVVWAASDAEWPEFDRSDRQYATDIRNILEAPFRATGHGGHGDHGTADQEAATPPHDDGAADREVARPHVDHVARATVGGEAGIGSGATGE